MRQGKHARLYSYLGIGRGPAARQCLVILQPDGQESDEADGDVPGPLSCLVDNGEEVTCMDVEPAQQGAAGDLENEVIRWVLCHTLRCSDTNSKFDDLRNLCVLQAAEGQNIFQQNQRESAKAC